MRTIRILGSAVILSASLIGCEDGPSFEGPSQIFDSTHDEFTDVTNGIAGNDPWSVDEGRGFESESSGDSVGRARFCDQSQADAQVQEMITAPIVPDDSIGKIPLWGEDYTPLLADSLLGSPSDSKFCDPSGTYANAFTFGPLNEIVVIFNEETRLIDYVYAQPGYLGALEGSAKNAEGTEQKIWIRAGDPIRVGNLELKDDAPDSAAHWANPVNINHIHRMIRGTFFPAAPAPALDFDCLGARICRILEIGAERALRIEDSGVVLAFPANGGAVQFIMVQPVRVAPFEAAMDMSFGAAALPDPVAPPETPVDPEEPIEPAPALAGLSPVFESNVFENCSLKLDGKTTWAKFKSGCIKADDTLNRGSFDVLSGRGAVRVDFNGVFLTFLHAKGDPLEDGARPADGDVLIGVSFTDNLNGSFAQWVPQSLGAHFKDRFEATVKGSLLASVPDHPFNSFSLGALPQLSTTAESLSPLMGMTDAGPVDLVNSYVSTAQQAYAALTAEQAAYVNPDLPKKTFLVAPFVEAALLVLTGGHSDEPLSVLYTVPSDDSLYVIGRAHFTIDGVPYRVFAQYNFVFGGIVYLGMERGFNSNDAPVNAAAAEFAKVVPALASNYYEHWLGLMPLNGYPFPNPFALGATNISVTGVDRQLNMLNVEIASTDGEGAPKTYKLKVRGAHIDDGSGFDRQTEGETSEFLRSHAISFDGRETALQVHVDANGTVQQTTQFTFKGPVYLCGVGTPPEIVYGQDVRATLDAFARQNPQAYRDCGIVFNYSPNGNVLNSVASVINKVSITLSGGRAVTVSAWQ